jgi:hypothetical protein
MDRHRPSTQTPNPTSFWRRDKLALIACHGAAREEEDHALEDVLRIDLTRGSFGDGDDETQDERQFEAGSEKRCDDEKERTDQHFDRDAPDGSVERHREFVDPIRSKRQLKREMKGVIIAIDK